jgi:hypothetical protein
MPTTELTTQWVAECFWPGVSDEDVRDIDRRVHGAVVDLSGRLTSASYLGSLRITDDEVVLFLFQGPIVSVQQLVQRAGIRAERILRCTRTRAS